MRTNQASELNRLQKENDRLRRAVSGLTAVAAGRHRRMDLRPFPGRRECMLARQSAHRTVPSCQRLDLPRRQ